MISYWDFHVSLLIRSIKGDLKEQSYSMRRMLIAYVTLVYANKIVHSKLETRSCIKIHV